MTRNTFAVVSFINLVPALLFIRFPFICAELNPLPLYSSSSSCGPGEAPMTPKLCT